MKIRRNSEEEDISKDTDTEPYPSTTRTEDDFYGDDAGYDDLGFGEDTLSPMEKHSDLLKQLTNFEPFIKAKINGWLGLRWDEDQSKWVDDKQVEAIMTRKCAAWCIDYLKTYTRDNNIITNIGKEEYNNIVSDIIDVVWIDIGTRTEEFGIENDGDLHRVCVELQHAAELILMGAGGGKYNELLSKATTRHENVNLSNPNQTLIYPQQKKVGMLGKLKKLLVGG